MYRLEDAAKVLPKRFMEKIRVTENGCWEWVGAKLKGRHQNYGIFHLPGTNSKVVRAHVFAYEMLVGAVPEGKELDHLCRNHPCVNPAHTETVTHRVNVQRGVGWHAIAKIHRSKTHCPKGHPYDLFNTHFVNGERHCRACARERAALIRQRKKNVQVI